MRKELFKVHYADYNLKIKADYITVEVFNSEHDLKTLSLQHKRLVYLLLECLRNEEKMFHIYVGQTDSNGVRRPLSSIKEKEMNPDKIVILYTEKDTDFSMDQLRYIESKLIAFVKTHPLLKDRNGQASTLTVSDDDEVTCEKRLAELSKILYTLGFWFMRDWGSDAQTIQAKYALPETTHPPQVEEKTAVEVIESTSVNAETSFDFSQFPIFEYRFPSRKFTHRKGWVARMKVTGVDSFTLLKGSYIEANDEYRACRKGCKGKAGDFALSYFKEKSKKLYFNPEEHAKFDQKSEAYITKVKLIFTAPSSPLDVALGRANNGWKEWKTAGGETLETVNARFGNPLGR